MKLKYRVRTFVLFLMLFTIFSTYFMPAQTAYGANLPYYDYTKGTNVNYSGKQVIYLYNSRELPLEQPGIIIDGTALADCDELFVQQLELSVTKENDQLTITDGAKTMIMTIGSKNVIMDGITQKMNVAPVKLSFFDGKVRIYVPTRIITEYFGFSYVWISSSSTVKITKTLSLHDGNHDFSYNGTFYSILYQGNEIPLGEMPIIYYEGTVLTRADIVFRTAGCFYEEFGNQILVSKGDIVISRSIGQK